jgi:Histidine ammonia-lyase
MVVKAADIAIVRLGDGALSLEQIVAVARHGARLEFSEEYERRVEAASALVDTFLDENRVIYGVTTGFGDNYKKTIDPADARKLQENIIISHAVSIGAPLPDEQVRAIQVVMLAQLGQGHSGTALTTLELIRQLLNVGVSPVVPGEGSVGYLALEAHMALVLIGRGRAVVDGEILPGAEALRRKGLAPVVLKAKEGLTLTNGIASVTGIASLVAHDAQRLSLTADVVGALSFEALRGTTRAYDARVQALRRHPEQAAAARNLLRILEGSSLAERHRDHRVQDPYLLRAMPQLHGAVKRSFADASRVVEEALESVGDNPVLFGDGRGGGDAVMVGNFDATFVGLATDGIKAAAAVLAQHSERRTDRMVNSAFSELPPFLAPDPGLNNGLMIPQYTAAALVMEMRGEVSPASVDSVPTSANQEDPVSNAYLATQQAYRAMHKLTYILAIEVVAAAQAVDLLDLPHQSSPALQGVRQLVRTEIPFAAEDREFGEDIVKAAEMLVSDALLDMVESTIGPLE